MDLIIEQTASDELWGRVIYDGSIITSKANTINELQEKLKKIIEDKHGIVVHEFHTRYS